MECGRTRLYPACDSRSGFRSQIPGYDYFGSGTASVTYSGVFFDNELRLGQWRFLQHWTDVEVVPVFPLKRRSAGPVLAATDSVGVANILITLAAPVKAFALNFDTFFGADVSFTLSNGDTLTLASGGNAYDLRSFFGVTDDTPFKTILLTSSDQALNLNALNFGAAVCRHSGAGYLGHAAAWLRRHRSFCRPTARAPCISPADRQGTVITRAALLRESGVVSRVMLTQIQYEAIYLM